jgi:hypothetical protein
VPELEKGQPTQICNFPDSAMTRPPPLSTWTPARGGSVVSVTVWPARMMASSVEPGTAPPQVAGSAQLPLWTD